jgi:hypothetical protein
MELVLEARMAPERTVWSNCRGASVSARSHTGKMRLVAGRRRQA